MLDLLDHPANMAAIISLRQERPSAQPSKLFADGRHGLSVNRHHLRAPQQLLVAYHHPSTTQNRLNFLYNRGIFLFGRCGKSWSVPVFPGCQGENGLLA